MVRYSDKIKSFIAENYKGIGPTLMADMLNKTFGTNFSAANLKNYYGRNKLNSGVTGYFKKGNIPHNKGKKMSPEVYEKCKNTMFAKGNIPKNHRPVGSERLSKDGYIEIKVEEPNKWVFKHKVLYEKANGPVPKGKIVIFADGNKENLSLDNLRLVSRRELLVLNQNRLLKKDQRLTDTAILISKTIIAKQEKSKK